jgi:hypothetical protein
MENWIEELAKQCQQTSQAKVGAALRKHQPDGFPSGTVINQVLKGKYPGKTDRLKSLVEGVYMSATVKCPIVDEIPTDQCIENQSKPFTNTNPTRRALYKACRNGCEHSKL